MLAVDTNVVVRFLTRDDRGRAERARKLFEHETIFLTKTVVLETAWVMRRLLGLPAGPVLQAIGGLIALPNVRCEDLAAVVDAIKWGMRGFDFADALHLASSHDADAFASFDKTLVRRAKRLGLSVVVA